MTGPNSSPYWGKLVQHHWPAISPGEWRTLAASARDAAKDVNLFDTAAAVRNFDTVVVSSARMDPVKDDMQRMVGVPQRCADVLTAAAETFETIAGMVHRTRNRILDVVDQALIDIAADPRDRNVEYVIRTAAAEIADIAEAARREVSPQSLPRLRDMADLMGAEDPWTAGNREGGVVPHHEAGMPSPGVHDPLPNWPWVKGLEETPFPVGTSPDRQASRPTADNDSSAPAPPARPDPHSTPAASPPAPTSPPVLPAEPAPPGPMPGDGAAIPRVPGAVPTGAETAPAVEPAAATYAPAPQSVPPGEAAEHPAMEPAAYAEAGSYSTTEPTSATTALEDPAPQPVGDAGEPAAQLPFLMLPGIVRSGERKNQPPAQSGERADDVGAYAEAESETLPTPYEPPTVAASGDAGRPPRVAAPTTAPVAPAVAGIRRDEPVTAGDGTATGSPGLAFDPQAVELAREVHALVACLPSGPVESLPARRVRERILSALSASEPVPDRWWAELRAADGFVQSVVQARMEDPTTAQDERAELDTLLLEQRCNELVLRLAQGDSPLRGLQAVVVAHREILDHPLLAGTGREADGDRESVRGDGGEGEVSAVPPREVRDDVEPEAGT